MKKNFALALFLCITFFLQAQELTKFQNFTYVDKISCIEEINSSQYLFGSEGGIIKYDSDTEDYIILNASQKILDINITSIEQINDKIFVAGTYSGKLYLIDNDLNTVIEEYNDLDDRIIVDIFHTNDTLWVATKNIVSVFKVIGNSMQYVDIFENFPINVGEITSVTVFKNKLYVSANNGLMKAPADYGVYSIKDVNLWDIITINGNQNPVVYDIYQGAENLYISGNDGLYSFFELNGIDSLELVFASLNRKAKMIDNKLYWASYNNIYKMENETPILAMTAGATIYDFVVEDSGILALTSHRGIYTQKEENISRKYFSLFPENIVGEVAVSSTGAYYVTNSPLPLNSTTGSYRLKNGTSIQYKWGPSSPVRWDRSNIVRNIKEILPGQFLMCSWGGGAWVVNENEDEYYTMNTLTGEFTLNINEFDGVDYTSTLVPTDKIERLPNVLSDCGGGNGYCIVSYAMVDKYNNYLWMSQYASNTNLIVVGYPIENNRIMWHDTLSAVKIYKPDNLNSNAINTLEVDQWGNLWVGSKGGGCAIINVPNLLNGSLQWSYLNETDNLVSNDVRYIKTDLDGYVWIGSAAGINVWTGSELYSGRGYSQPMGITIQYIHVDKAGNRWFATDRGISMLKYFATPWNSDNDWVHYNSLASFDEDLYDSEQPSDFYIDLPKTEFKSITVDPYNGNLVIGSYAGLLVSGQATVLPAYDKKQDVIAFPNPVKFGKKHQQVYFKNVQAGANIKIFSITGELIRELLYTEGSDFEGFWGKWDGKNSEGKEVNTGVYIFSACTEDGNVNSGKIFVIREN